MLKMAENKGSTAKTLDYPFKMDQNNYNDESSQRAFKRNT